MAGETQLTHEQIVALRDVLFPQLVRLIHRGTAFLEYLHGTGEFSVIRRGILIDLERRGPQTVPQIARVRAVSRQYVQRVVNGLVADGLAELSRNPAHRRSSLVQVTPEGSALVTAMLDREAALFARLPLDASEDELQDAAALMCRIVAALDDLDLSRPQEDRDAANP